MPSLSSKSILAPSSSSLETLSVFLPFTAIIKGDNFSISVCSLIFLDNKKLWLFFLLCRLHHLTVFCCTDFFVHLYISKECPALQILYNICVRQGLNTLFKCAILKVDILILSLILSPIPQITSVIFFSSPMTAIFRNKRRKQQIFQLKN